MNDKTVTAPLHDNLRDLIGQAISDEIAAGAAQPDWCDSREIDRLADAVLAVLPKRRTALSPELRSALEEAAKTGASLAEVPGGGLVFINRGEQPEDDLDLNCPACGGSGHADDARGAAPASARADDAFAAFCDREGYPSDGPFDTALCKAFDAGRAAHPSADATPAWDADATKRLRSIVELLSLQSSVPDGDLTGYEFAVLGFVRREIERLKAKADAAPVDAKPVALEQLHTAAAQHKMALVPLHLTRAMLEVLAEEWEWEDLLAAAEAITDEQYAEVSAGPSAAQRRVEELEYLLDAAQSAAGQDNERDSARWQFMVEASAGTPSFNAYAAALNEQKFYLSGSPQVRKAAFIAAVDKARQKMADQQAPEGGAA